MNQLGFPLLSITIFLPLVGALVVMFLGRKPRVLKAWSLVVTLITLALTAVLWGLFDYGTSEMQFVDRFLWIEALGIQYYVGVDGVSLWLLMW